MSAPADVRGAPEGAGLDVRALICAYDWPCDEALRVVYGPTPACPHGESGGDPSAISPDGRNVGLFEINLVHGYTVAQLLDPPTNIRVAYAIWREQGWSPWSCKPW